MKANATCPVPMTMVPASSTLREPNRSQSSPTGTCMPAYTSSWSIVNVASWAAEMPNRSAATRPATPSEERWKTASA